MRRQKKQDRGVVTQNLSLQLSKAKALEKEIKNTSPMPIEDFKRIEKLVNILQRELEVLKKRLK